MLVHHVVAVPHLRVRARVKKKLEKALAVDAGFPERDDAKALLEKIGNSG